SACPPAQLKRKRSAIKRYKILVRLMNPFHSHHYHHQHHHLPNLPNCVCHLRRMPSATVAQRHFTHLSSRNVHRQLSRLENSAPPYNAF
ncbi:unnamed protein product, partial [Ceratitis capitata]